MAQRPTRKQIGLALGYRRMLQDADFLQLLNEDERRLIEPLQLNQRVRIVPNGVFLEEIEPLPRKSEYRQILPQLGGRRYILFLARLHRMKGLDVLAEAFEQVAQGQPEVDLVVAGPDDGAGAAFRARISDAGLEQRVHVVGPLYGRSKLQAMVDAAVFCLPSRREGFSIAVLEAMACGCPVVLSEQCHFQEVSDAAAGVIVPLTAQALAQTLERILLTTEEADRMGRNGAAFVRSRYTWPHIAGISLDAYKEIAGPCAKTPAGR